MTEQISTLESNLYLVGLYIQENALKGYKLVEGYPILTGWQYETMMELTQEAVVEPKKAVGRPKS